MKIKLFSILIALSLLQSACLSASAKSVNLQQVPGGPVKLTGDFTYTNGFVLETYFVEQAVALVDMHGFVVRDQLWTIPVQGQVLGFMALDKANKKGTYEIQLPAAPEGTFNDLSRASVKQKGVQVFSVAYWANLAGGPYDEGDDKAQGWPGYLTSTVVDGTNNDEVTGGKLVVWAPDATQQFPTGFGADGKLFTADDPLGSLPAGYSVIDLDAKPFGVSQEAQPSIKLYEPNDFAIKDFSKETYSKAFDDMFQFVRTNYAFNDVPGKPPAWDKLYADLAPRVKAAETAKDTAAYYQAIKEFTMAFKDSHVGLDGGKFSQADLQQKAGGGYGFAITELDNKKVIVSYLLNNGPAAAAGIQLGAEITKFNNLPTGQAIGQVKPLSGPFSTDTEMRSQQARYLLRAPLGTQASISYINPGGTEKAVTLTTVGETGSFSVTSLYYGYDPVALPVEYKILESGIGYVKIDSYHDDLNLIIRLFNRALDTFQQNQVTSIIIDLRQNPGGNPLGLAGFIYNKDIPLGQLEYFDSKTNKFTPNGAPGKITPNVEQFTFSKVAVLVSQACASACDFEAYGFSQVPGTIVVGETGTNGAGGEVGRGQFLLPEEMSMQVPTGRDVLPDGSILLEGKGVQPTLRVPITQDTALSKGDPVLDAAVKAVAPVQ